MGNRVGAATAKSLAATTRLSTAGVRHHFCCVIADDTASSPYVAAGYVRRWSRRQGRNRYARMLLMSKIEESIRWARFPITQGDARGRQWLEIQVLLGLAPNTIEAYGRGLEQFLRWSKDQNVVPEAATRADIANYVGFLRDQPGSAGSAVVAINSGSGLSNATLQQRLTVVRLFFDYLVEEDLRRTNPVGRGRYTPNMGFAAKRTRGLVRRYSRLPWIPSEAEWCRFAACAEAEPIRNRCMIGFAYDSALRREELCSVEIGDIDPAHRLLRVRAETSKSNRDRVTPYSEATGQMFVAYLRHRRHISRDGGRLFLSESARNYGKPITRWTWSKIVRRIANAASLPGFSTHTLRHLCLTDLARAGWDVHEIANLAGHRNLATTQKYIHLSGRDLAAKLAEGMDQIHAWRSEQLARGHASERNE